MEAFFVIELLPNVYVYLFDGDISKFHYDPNEVIGIASVNAKDALQLFETESGSIKARMIREENNQIMEQETNLELKNFLVNKGETALTKYGDVLKKVIELLQA